MACANREEATLICRHEGGGGGFPCFGQGIFNAEKIGFKNSSSWGKKKVHLKELKIWGWVLLGLVSFFFLLPLPSKFMFALD